MAETATSPTTDIKAPLTPDPKTGLIPMSDYFYQMIEDTILAKAASRHFENYAVVFVYWGPEGYPEGYENDDNPPVYARVIRGRNIVPDSIVSIAVTRVESEIDAFDQQEFLGDDCEYTEDGNHYVEDDNVPAPWMQWLESVATDEVERRTDKLRAYRNSLKLNS